MVRVHLSEEQQAELRRRASSRETPPRTRDRLEMVRLADAGWSIPRIARLLHKSEAVQVVQPELAAANVER